MNPSPPGARLSLATVHGLMLMAAGLVSTSFTVGKAIAPGLDPAVLTLFRFLIAALLMLPWVRRRFGPGLPDGRALLRYSLISGVLVGFFWLMFLSLRYTTALNTGVLYTLVPGISSVYSALLLRERLGRYRLMALLLAMAGAIWVIFRGDISRLLAMDLNRGDLIFFAGCLLIALYTPLVKLLHRGESMIVMTFWVLVTGTFWLLLLSGNRLASISWSGVAPMVWAGIVYLAVFSTIVTFFLTQLATLYLGPTRVTAYSYLYPPYILLLDWIFGHGLPSLRTLAGVALILMAMVVVQKGAVTVHRYRQPPKDTDTFG
ncbi:DMT family transporter [Thermodesulfobacteriota bacterium B35]